MCRLDCICIYFILLGHSIMPSQADSPIVMQRKAKRVIDSDSDIEELPNSQTVST